jgi:hypothetical protein
MKEEETEDVFFKKTYLLSIAVPKDRQGISNI